MATIGRHRARRILAVIGVTCAVVVAAYGAWWGIGNSARVQLGTRVQAAGATGPGGTYFADVSPGSSLTPESAPIVVVATTTRHGFRATAVDVRLEQEQSPGSWSVVWTDSAQVDPADTELTVTLPPLTAATLPTDTYRAEILVGGRLLGEPSNVLAVSNPDMASCTGVCQGLLDGLASGLGAA